MAIECTKTSTIVGDVLDLHPRDKTVVACDHSTAEVDAWHSTSKIHSVFESSIRGPDEFRGAMDFLVACIDLRRPHFHGPQRPIRLLRAFPDPRTPLFHVEKDGASNHGSMNASSID